jgi:hypothetical protein
VTLMLDTHVPYGNACHVSVTRQQDGWTVAFAADPHGGPETLWFAFRLRHEDDAGTPIGKVRLVLKHFGNMLGGKRPEDFRPVARLAGRDWERMAAGCTESLPDGRTDAAWTLDVPAPHVDIATCYPYGMPEVDSLVRETGGYWRADGIGVSQAGRPLVRLSNGPGCPGGDRAGLYMVARQHSGETPGSWVLDGFLRQIAAAGEKAPLVWAVPLTNIDGVEQGDYGKDNFPYDLNRAWGRPAMRHENLVFQQDIERWRRRCRPVLALDFHAPGLCETDGCYCYLPKPGDQTPNQDQAGKWTARLAAALAAEYAAASFHRVVNYRSRWETPTFSAYLAGVGVCGLCMEVPYSQIGQKVLTRKEYAEIGRRVARGVVEYLGS